MRVYALEEIAVEKLVALTDRARNEPRDLYDLWYLTSEGLVDFGTLIPELEAKLAFRGRTRDAMTAELGTKEARDKKLWPFASARRWSRCRHSRRSSVR